MAIRYHVLGVSRIKLRLVMGFAHEVPASFQLSRKCIVCSVHPKGCIVWPADLNQFFPYKGFFESVPYLMRRYGVCFVCAGALRRGHKLWGM